MTKEEILVMVKNWLPEWKASNAVFLQRLDTCRVCDKFVVNMGLERCSQCGCVLLIKANSLKSKCPENKW